MKYLVESYDRINNQTGFVENIKLPLHVKEVKGVYPMIHIPEISKNENLVLGALSLSSLNGNTNIFTDLPVFFEPERKTRYRHIFYPFNFTNPFNTYLRIKFMASPFLNTYMNNEGASNAHLIIIIAYE